MVSLRDLDVQSRAAVSLVEEWQGQHKALRAIWKLEDVVKLILAAIASAREVQEGVCARNGQVASKQGSPQTIKHEAAYLLEALRRLSVASDGVTRVVDMFESEGYSLGLARELREQTTTLPEMIGGAEALCEDLEWEELEETALPSATIRAVAAYLASTGQASA